MRRLTRIICYNTFLLKILTVYIDMARHSKKRQAYRTTSTRRSGASSKSTSRVWLMTGLLMGILGASGIFVFATQENALSALKESSLFSALMHHLEKPKSVAENKILKKNKKKAKKQSLAQKKEAPRFEFYQALPGMEVPLPENQSTTPLPLATTKAPTAPKTPIKHDEKPNRTAMVEKKLAAAHYLVQAGTFRDLPTAEALKTRLGKEGLTSKIQKIAADDGIWFRVILGPFSSETIALTHKNKLTKENIQSFLILQRQ